MATVQKTTFRRYNGIDWDAIYFSSCADITILGSSYTVEKDAEGFSYGDVLEANDSVAMLLVKTINRLTTLEVERIAALESGSGITEIDASKITGVIDRANLPADVGGKGVPVASEEAKDALTRDDVNIGDIVKVENGKIYLVTGEEPDDPDVENGPTHLTFMTLADDQSEVDWERLINTPTTVDGYGITDGVRTTDTVDHGNKREDDAEDFTAASKVAKTNADGKLDFDITGDAATLGGNAPEYYASAESVQDINDALGDAETDGSIRKDIATLQEEMKNQDASWIKTGTINLARLPKAAISELHIITSEDDLANLTTEQVQLGDTVKIADELNEDGTIKVAGGMFYVADETKLGTEDYMDAFVPYTASAASSVYWSGVLETPTTLAGYGITDAVNVNQLANKGGAAAAAKVAQANADGRLDFDITGDAATLGGNAPEYYSTKSAVDTLRTEYENTVSTVEKLVEQVMGTPSTGEPGPSEDPENPVYTGDLDNATAGEEVTWAGRKWIVAEESSEGYVILAANSIIMTAQPTIPSSMIDQYLTDLGETLGADAMALIANGLFVPSSTDVRGYTGMTADNMVFTGHNGNKGWWLTDGWVNTAGEIELGHSESGMDIRPFAKIDLAHPDTPPVEDTKSILDRVVDIETILGDAETEGTVLGDIAKLQTEIDWKTIINTPTTLEGYGITDGVNVADVIENGIYNETDNADVAGKLVKIGSDNKLHVDIAGDAATLGGHDADYFASKSEFDKLALSVPVILDSVDEFPDPQVGQVVIVPAEVYVPADPDEGGETEGGVTIEPNPDAGDEGDENAP